MPLRLSALVIVLALCACAPRATQDYALFTAREGSLTHQTLEAPFYRVLLDLGVQIRSYEAFRYDGQDASVPRQLVEELTRGEAGAGFCAFRGNSFRTRDGQKVLVLVANGAQKVRGVIYDLSRRPRLTYTIFEGSSYRPLLERRQGASPALGCG